MDTNSYIHSLLMANPLRESILRSVIETLQLPSGSRGLDAGCGIGLQCLWLAKAVGLTGHVTGVDMSSEFLNRGWKIAKEAGLSERISFKEGKEDKTAYWKHLDWEKAFKDGMNAVGLEYSRSYKWKATWMYWRLNHEVMPADGTVL